MDVPTIGELWIKIMDCISGIKDSILTITRKIDLKDVSYGVYH